MPPQALQIVVLARCFGKDVNNELAVIDEYPFPTLITFHTSGSSSQVF